LDNKTATGKYVFCSSMIEQNSNLPPQFSELANKQWILYGEMNDYPDYLVELYNRSSTHNAIVKGKHRYICGQGFKPNQELPPDQLKIAEEFILNVNQNGQGLMDVISPAVLDWLISGNLVLKGKVGILEKKPKDLYHKDWSRFRISTNDNLFYESEYWVFDPKGNKRSYTFTPQDIKTIKKFSYDQTSGEGLIYYRDPRPQLKFYGLPEYMAAIQDIETEIAVAEFHNNNVKSGFSAGFIIEFNNGVPEPDEQAAIVRDLKEKYTAAINTGEPFVTFSDSKERGVTVTPIRPNDLDKQFAELRKDVTQSIVTNHNITSPMLLAIKTEGQLGGNNEILTAAQMFQNTYVTPKQQVVENIVNKWFQAKYGFNAGIYIEILKPVKESLPLSSVMDVMTDDEKRELAGLPPMTKEQRSELDVKKKEAQEVKFMAEDGTDELLQALKDCAIDLDGEIIAERPCRTEEDFSPEMLDRYEKGFQQFVSVYDLPYYQSIIYQYLETHKDELSILGIAAALNIAASVVIQTLTDLQKENYINFKQTKDGGITSVKINPVSDAALKEGVPAYQLVTRWRYSGPNDDRTRLFCRRMLNEEGLAGKLWKREDIDRLSIQEGRNVWLTRGGWYTLPNGNKRPSCRHFWSQVIVKLKA